METRQHHQRIRRRSVCASCDTRYTTAEIRVDQLRDSSKALSSHQAAALLDSIQSMEESLNMLRRQIEAAFTPRPMRANLPPKFANAVLRDDGRLHEFTLKVAGRRFFCDCGCNVFHKPDRSQTELYECNACGVRFISPSTRTPLLAGHTTPASPPTQ